MTDFWHMGGYGFYVWGAYGGALLAVVAEIVALRWRWSAARDAAPDATRGIGRERVIK